MNTPSNKSKWVYPRGRLADDTWDLHLDLDHPPIPEWKYTGLRVATLRSGESLLIPADDKERIILVLEGDELTVSYRGAWENEFTSQRLRGRKTVFHGTSDLLYLPLNTEIQISGYGRMAIGECRAFNSKPVQYIAKESVPVDIRGAGRESRQIHNFGMPLQLDADRMIVVEAIVPAGNWSGAPAHKHDVYIPGLESQLEELYYFESSVTREVDVSVSTQPFGIFRGYSADEREFDVTEEVHSGDLVLVPYGWHGPVAAGPGFDLYFFNVMAGADPTREWNVTDHPYQAWIRESWASQKPDSRLPYLE